MENRDIVFFDLETTGVEVKSAKIVQMAIMKADHNLNRLTETFSMIFDPEAPIPKQASDVHGITDEMVKGQPTFKQKAAQLYKFIGNCHFGTYNGNKFDIPILIREFSEAGVQLDLDGRMLLDSCSVFMEKEKRDLTAALKFYCGKELEGAHEAGADVDATFEVMKGQMERYDDVSSVSDINTLSGAESRVDVAGFLEKDEEGNVVFKVGKHKGTKVVDAYATDQGYFRWLYKEAPLQTQNIITELLNQK